jgi:hypothetical protein
MGDFAVSDYYSASGFMGDGENRGFLTVTRDEDCKPRPDGAQGSCFHFTYNVGVEGWSGVYWQYPANNWGYEPGRAIGDTYQTVRFVASAEYRIVRPAGEGIGGSCAVDDDCRPGLGCASGSCQPAGTRALGQNCLISAECEAGLQCSAQECVAAGDAVDGEACRRGDDADCAAGLRCSGGPGAYTCGPDGAGDVDDACDSRSDCRAGLLCSSEGTCYPRTEMGPFRFLIGGITGYEYVDNIAPEYNALPPAPFPVLTADPQEFSIDLGRTPEFENLIGGFMWASAFPDVDALRMCDDTEKVDGECPPVAYLADLSQPAHVFVDNIVFEAADGGGQ